MRNRIERSRYAQIALTYTKPLPIRIWAASTAIGVLWIAVTTVLVGTTDSGVHAAMLFLGGSMAVWVGAMIAAHAKEQLADPRASLVPHFRTPHLVVAAVMFLVLVIGLASAVAGLQAWVAVHDVSLTGYLAFVLVLTALLAWMAQLQSPAMLIPIAAVLSPVMFADGRAWLSEILRGGAPKTGYVLLSASIAALVALWWRLSRMHEEMPDYACGVSPGLRLKVRMTGDPIFRRENAAGASRIETFVRHAARFDYVPNIAAAGFWRRARHWRHVIGTGRMPIFVAALLGVWVPLLHSTMTKDDVGLMVALVAASMVPGQMFAATWPRRWYVLGEESLRPASRRQFLREQGAAMALEYALTWAWLSAVTFTSATLFARWPYGVFAQLMMALPLMAGVQVLIFGILVWILRFRAGWLIIAPIFLVTAIGLAALIAGGTMAHAREVGMIMLVAALLTVTGVGITLDAYRRWLVTELD